MAASLRTLAVNFRGHTAKSLRSVHDETLTFISSIKECVDRGESRELKEFVCDGEYKGFVEYIAWDLLPIIGPYLTDNDANNSMYNDCMEIVNKLAELGSEKEMFIGLLEQVHRFLHTLIHSDFLRPLQTVINRLGITKPLYYKQLLSTLYAHMQTLQVPSVNGMGIMERRLMSQDPDFSQVESTVLTLLDFLSPLVRDVQCALVGNDERQRFSPKEIIEIKATRTQMMKFTLHLLGHPLIAIDFKYLEDAEEEEMRELGGISKEARQRITHSNDDHLVCKLAAEKCMAYLDCMGCNFTDLFFYADRNSINLDALEEERKRKARRKEEEEEEDGDEDDDEDEDEDEDEDDDTLSILGLSCFAYMIIVEGYKTLRMPTVYSTVYMVRVTMPYVEAMLRHTDEPIIVKGLELLKSLVEKVDDHSLESGLINSKYNFLQVSECLVQVMILCPFKPMRRMSMSLLPAYLNCFDWKGRYRLLRSLLFNVNHPGVSGLLIRIIKDYVHQSLESDSSNDWFVGKRIQDLYPIIFQLDYVVNSDLLNDANKHMGSLNFLRYLLLRDKPEKNATRIWSRLDGIRRDYLQPLRLCLDMSMANYANKLILMENEISIRDREAVAEKKCMKGILTSDGNILPEISLPDQIKGLKFAQYTFDLIASIICRIEEILSSIKSSPTEAASSQSTAELGGPVAMGT